MIINITDTKPFQKYLDKDGNGREINLYKIVNVSSSKDTFYPNCMFHNRFDVFNPSSEKIMSLQNIDIKPDDLVNRVPSAGLWADQTDEGELGFTYDDFEKYWRWKLSRSGDCPVTESIVNKIEKLHKITEHKRNLPPYYKRKE